MAVTKTVGALPIILTISPTCCHHCWSSCTRSSFAFTRHTCTPCSNQCISICRDGQVIKHTFRSGKSKPCRLATVSDRLPTTPQRSHAETEPWVGEKPSVGPKPDSICARTCILSSTTKHYRDYQRQ
ncbi:hypothetical protein, variant [Exophiala xenobiotica]|uniref:Secreted protein n=1 Tax=Exophiala xenobiotica TaxID=348802 RepID=A0A0D2EB03_9EURO|nr:hypothetical protein, variant [Exophiala xenobiotica]XP_013312440.1 uncharacterized protein PV05_10538 [Exophiala xenobiotica]KIW51855.1 hypothetical protein PV05_10538 [Exophiala xenobiotica]KIW51856.1 hypothetical protein, variant [Exophiala xenobiotica]